VNFTAVVGLLRGTWTQVCQLLVMVLASLPEPLVGHGSPQRFRQASGKVSLSLGLTRPIYPHRYHVASPPPACKLTPNFPARGRTTPLLRTSSARPPPPAHPTQTKPPTSTQLTDPADPSDSPGTLAADGGLFRSIKN